MTEHTIHAQTKRITSTNIKLKMFYETKLHKYTLNGKQNETRKRIQTSL